jgi:HAD superfamily phosphoserine phosphatase-like hydrolase
MPNQPSPAQFVNSVVRLQPAFATFDCDGTLWSGDAGEGFFDWELRRKVVSDEVVAAVRARYADYRAGKVSEDAMCGEMVTLHQGLRESEVKKFAAEFFEERMVQSIFPEMQELVGRLIEAGSDVWAVSSTNHWVIEAAMKHFGIPSNKILAATVEVRDGIVTDKLTRIPSGEGKPRAIRAEAKRDPDAAFGNSRWDAAMLDISRHAFAINPNPDLETLAKKKGWTIYFPRVASTSKA